MVGLIEQIQGDALDENVLVSTLLRKLKVAAAKLNVGEVEQWVLNELNGYEGRVPDYRFVVGSPMAFNPYRGWIPLSGDLSETLSRRAIGQSIRSLEDLAYRSAKGKGTLEIPFPAELCARIDKLSNFPFYRYSLHIDSAQLIGVIDTVRNLVLDWATDLDKNGIRGEGLSFTEREKEQAQHASSVFHIGSIGSLTGNLGIANNSGNISSSNMDFGAAAILAQKIEKYMSALEADGVNAQLVQARLDVVKSEIASSNQEPSRLRGALVDLRNALSGAGGSLLASGIIEGISKLLGG